MKHAVIISLCAVIGVACTPAPSSTPVAPQPAQQNPAPQTAAQPVASAPSDKTTVARVRVVNMDGQPLPNMMPIAAKQPNAFEKPIAQGALTDADGKGVVLIPQDEWLYVRAWDPTRRVFANNYFDVLPGNATQTEEMVITMVPGASLAMELVTQEGAPAAAQNVGIMMFHPTRGPWWPDEADSDKDGKVTFASLPPGKYTIKLKTADGHRIDIPDVVLPPSGSTDLGVVALQ